MMKRAYDTKTGMRRMSDVIVSTQRAADAFPGLPDGLTHRHVLAAFKRAAPYVGISARTVHLVDQLMSWSRAIDWTQGQRPVVFPSNETLGRKLGVGTRQLQKMLSAAAALGLVVHRDSANGNRSGARGADGRLVYAYGIDLSPLASRHDEFVLAAEEGMATERRVSLLRRRLSAGRRRIRTLVDFFAGQAASAPATETALTITAEVRGTRCETKLLAAVARMDELVRQLNDAAAGHGDVSKPSPVHVPGSPCDELKDASITTTRQLDTAKAEYRIRPTGPKAGHAMEVGKTARRPEDGRRAVPEEEELQLVAEIASTMVESGDGPLTWGSLVATAERLARQSAIRHEVWEEALSIMGERAAAAAVIALIAKHMHGEVERPGAYLRGMIRKARTGELELTKTLRHLRSRDRSEPPRFVASGQNALSIGELLASRMRRDSAHVDPTHGGMAYPKARVPDRPPSMGMSWNPDEHHAYEQMLVLSGTPSRSTVITRTEMV